MLFSQRLPNSSPPQKVSEGVRDLFILLDSVITSIDFRRSQPPLSLIVVNVVYLIKETCAIKLRNLLKPGLNHSSNTFFADFCCRQGISCPNPDINGSSYGSVSL